MNNFRTIGILSLVLIAGILVVTAGVLWVSRETRPPFPVVPPSTMEPGNGETRGGANAPPVFQARDPLKVYVNGAVVTQIHHLNWRGGCAGVRFG